MRADQGYEAYNNSYNERIRSIEFSKRRPDRTAKAELKFNRFPSTLRNASRKSNINTIAYEDYAIHPVLEAEEDNNFAKNYYKQNMPENVQFNNEIVEETKERLNQSSAYVLAEQATKDYIAFASQRMQHLKSARQRAKASFNDHFEQKKLDMEALRAQQKQWIVDYVRKVEALIEHIFGVKGKEEDPADIQERIFLRENRDTTAKVLKGVKVRDPSSALQILQSLRAVLLKRKDALTAQREEQQHHRSMSASAIDQSSSQNVSGTSFVSVATEASQAAQGQEHFAEQYCDFEGLKKKWGVSKVEEIKNIIRRLLGSGLVNKAEGRHMRQKRKAREKDQLAIKQMQRMGQSLPSRQQSKRKGNVRRGAKSQQKPIKADGGEIEIVPYYKQALNKDQASAKQAMLKGGQFDSIGDIFTRNRDYSQVFKKRTMDCTFDLSLIKDDDPHNHSTKARLR